MQTTIYKIIGIFALGIILGLVIGITEHPLVLIQNSGNNNSVKLPANLISQEIPNQTNIAYWYNTASKTNTTTLIICKSDLSSLTPTTNSIDGVDLMIWNNKTGWTINNPVDVFPKSC